MERLVVERAQDGTTLWTVDVAGSFAARLRGLMGRASLADGHGLYFPGTNSIHMLFMRFAIDCLFLDKPEADGRQRVIDVRANLRPWTGVVWWVGGARGALELTAGAAAGANIRPGDYVRLAPAA
jgi:uncharacterized membrane protein (UPF0127 family)